MPLAAGVGVGDLVWSLVALLGVGAAAQAWAEVLVALRYVGAAILVWMGVQMVRTAEARAVTAGRLGRESGGAGFAAGRSVIAGNPKAILFYMGVLPGFFDLKALTGWDVAVICLVSVAVPFGGNLAWAALFARARRWLADQVAMRRAHVAAGEALVAVGVAIAVGWGVSSPAQT